MNLPVILDSLAASCRDGLQSLSDHRESAFFGFPKATCGPATEIMGRILKEKAGLDGEYICGRGHPRLKPGQSHAWFEVGDYIVDVTHDQFDDTGLTGWVFRRNQGWHAEFAEIERIDGFCMPANWPSYPYDGYSAVVRELSKPAIQIEENNLVPIGAPIRPEAEVKDRDVSLCDGTPPE